MDGRDIGTVVFPDAELKIFMTADEEIRAKRRFEELRAKGVTTTLKDIMNNLNKRDSDDSNRSDSPLIQAEDARILDNSFMSREDQFKLALSWAQEAIRKVNS
jgi:cytidylate kinase